MRKSEKRWNKCMKWPQGYRGCLSCNEIKPLDNFHKHRQCFGGYNSVCKTCRKPVSKKNYRETPSSKRLWQRAKRRSNTNGTPFTIGVNDIIVPDLCPVLGKKMKAGTRYAASLDRIDPNKGYVPGNIIVMSRRANTLKNNGTIEEFEMVLTFLRKMREI